MNDNLTTTLPLGYNNAFYFPIQEVKIWRTYRKIKFKVKVEVQFEFDRTFLVGRVKEEK